MIELLGFTACLVVVLVSFGISDYKKSVEVAKLRMRPEEYKEGLGFDIGSKVYALYDSQIVRRNVQTITFTKYGVWVTLSGFIDSHKFRLEHISKSKEQLIKNLVDTCEER